MSEFKRFIKNHSVYSKTSNNPVVEEFEGIRYIFIEGYPMTMKTYQLLSLKSIFGGNAKLRVAEWQELHAETKQICEGLSIPLIKDREAFSLVAMFRRNMDIVNGKAYDTTKIKAMIDLLESKVHE